jgi:hypothetical protein
MIETNNLSKINSNTIFKLAMSSMVLFYLPQADYFLHYLPRMKLNGTKLV